MEEKRSRFRKQSARPDAGFYRPQYLNKLSLVNRNDFWDWLQKAIFNSKCLLPEKERIQLEGLILRISGEIRCKRFKLQCVRLEEYPALLQLQEIYNGYKKRLVFSQDGIHWLHENLEKKNPNEIRFCNVSQVLRLRENSLEVEKEETYLRNLWEEARRYGDWSGLVKERNLILTKELKQLEESVAKCKNHMDEENQKLSIRRDNEENWRRIQLETLQEKKASLSRWQNNLKNLETDLLQKEKNLQMWESALKEKEEALKRKARGSWSLWEKSVYDLQ